MQLRIKIADRIRVRPYRHPGLLPPIHRQGGSCESMIFYRGIQEVPDGDTAKQRVAIHAVT